MAKNGINLGPVDLSSDVLSFHEYFTIDHFHFSYVTPQCPDTPICPLYTHPHPQYRYLVVKSGTTAGHHDMSSACGSGWCFVRCTPTPSPSMPWIPPGRGIWWPRVVLTWLSLIWALVLLSAMGHLEFSRVLCNRPSSLFICNNPPMSPVSPLMPHPTPSTGIKWSRVVLLQVSMTCHQPGGHADVLSYVPPPHQPLCPSIPPGRGIWWPRVVLTWVPLTWAHVLLSAVLNRPSWVSRVLHNRPSWLFRCHPQCPLTPPFPHQFPWCLHPTLTPVQTSSGQEWYYCRSAWHFISLWARLMFCQMYPPSHHPYAPWCPHVEASSGQEW